MDDYADKDFLVEDDWGPWPTRILWTIFTGALLLIALNWDTFKPILFGH